MIEAAGGVVLRERDGEVEVLVVHRVRYDDWSLPKGKLDPGETAESAAVREVEEETGVLVEHTGTELPDVTYPTTSGTKHVRWFLVRPVAGDPVERPPDEEVDQARWVGVTDAPDLLSYDQDRSLLHRALTGDHA